MSSNYRHLKLMSNFSFQDLLVISAVSSFVTIFTILWWGFCARNVGRCRRSVAVSLSASQVASTPVRDLADSMEMAAFTPISIPDYFFSCPDVSSFQCLCLFLILVDQTSQIGDLYVFLFHSQICPFGKTIAFVCR